MKKVFIIVTFLLGVTLVAMLLTKPEPKKHYDAMIGLAQNVVDQEVTSNNVKKNMAQMGAKKLAELGIEGVDEEALEQLGADVDLTEVTELGKDLAMNTAGFYLQSHMKGEDFFVVNVGMVNYKGMDIPITVGILGSVHRLVDEEQVRHLLRE